MAAIPFDRARLHDLLWERRDARGALMLKQYELADELGIGRPWMSELIREFITDGRLLPVTTRRIGRSREGVRVTVADPALWGKQHPLPTREPEVRWLDGQANTAQAVHHA